MTFSRVKKLGVLGHVGNRNLGDEAIITAVIQNIRHRFSDAEIYGFSINPTETEQRHKIRSFAIRRKRRNISGDEKQRQHQLTLQPLKKQTNLRDIVKPRLKTMPLVYPVLSGIRKTVHVLFSIASELNFIMTSMRNLKGIDVLIIAGSGQLADMFGGPWGFPYTLLKWCLIAKASGTKVAFLSVGAGPLRSRLSRLFVKHALSCATYRSYRDESSKKLIEKLGVSGENLIFPDLAVSLRRTERPSASCESRSALIVGINPIPFFASWYWPESNNIVYENYIGTLASFAMWLIERGYRVLFFPTQLRADPSVVRDIRLLMGNDGMFHHEARVIDRPICSFEDLLRGISMTEIVVATRFHGVLFSYLMYKPVLGISYHRKTDDLMTDMGQAHYLLDINRISLDLLKERFMSLEPNREIVRRQIASRISDYRYALETQYDRVFNQIYGVTAHVPRTESVRTISSKTV